MKKTKSMRVAVGMLALTLMTSCFVGGTFAKYTTSGSANDTARVAKFGVTISAEATTFAETYETHDGAVKGTIANSVVSTAASDDGADDKVVAPGTSGNMAAISISGTPEVAVKVAYSATMTLDDNWKDEEGNFYCPLIITVGTTEIKQTTGQSKADFVKAVTDAIAAFSENYQALTDLSTIGTDGAPSVSWKWKFEGDTGEVQTDEKDTYLGDQAAEGKAATIELNITATVTQID